MSASWSAATRTRPLRLTLKGDTGHAGGTPMAMRRNALVGAGYVISAVNDVGLAYAADEGRHHDDAHRGVFPTCPAPMPRR